VGHLVDPAVRQPDDEDASLRYSPPPGHSDVVCESVPPGGNDPGRFRPWTSTRFRPESSRRSELVPGGEQPAMRGPEVGVDTSEHPGPPPRRSTSRTGRNGPDRAGNEYASQRPFGGERRAVALRGLVGVGAVGPRDPDGRLLALDMLVREPGGRPVLPHTAARDERRQRRQRSQAGGATPP
jgi:hypothetical protein